MTITIIADIAKTTVKLSKIIFKYVKSAELYSFFVRSNAKKLHIFSLI